MDWSTNFHRSSKATIKQSILSLIAVAHVVLPLQMILSVIGMSERRFYSWRAREQRCDLEDHSSCPKVSPTRLTPQEEQTIVKLATDRQYSHLPLSGLANLAKRTGQVVASVGTWTRIIRKYKLSRKKKKWDTRDKMGLRAAHPNEYWHIDVTVLQLSDRTKAYIHVVIDNFSRYILAWSICRELRGVTTRSLLESAISRAGDLKTMPVVVCDGGPENFNRDVDQLINDDLIDRRRALFDIDQSNSLIEALFRSAKHNYLYTLNIPSFETLIRRLNFYFQQHNEVIPHSALRGATPEEVYQGQWDSIIKNSLPLASKEAVRKRIEYHQNLKSCGLCR